MKKVLMCVDSLFQFIIATNLRLTIYKKDSVDIIIYNSFSSSIKLLDAVKANNIYDHAYLANTALTYCGNSYTFSQKFPKYIVYVCSLIKPKQVLKTILGTELNVPYDYMLFNGDGALPECIFNVCVASNPRLECYRLEDSYVSYMKEFGSVKGGFRIAFEKVMHTLFGTKNIRDYIRGYYFSEPGLCQVKLPYKIFPAPKISRNNVQLVELLNSIFEYKPLYNNEFAGKVVYFEDGASFFAGGDIELEVMQKIIQIIPKENILVKRHPRRKEDRFAAMGIKCCTVNSIPWEVIQLNCCFDGQIFIGVCSGAIFNSDIYFGDKCKKILTYRLMAVPPPVTMEKKFAAIINNYKKIYGKDSLCTPVDYMELESALSSNNEFSNTLH